MLQIWLIGALVWNSIVFILYVLDKRRAVRGQWRISEKNFITGNPCLWRFWGLVSG